ncbi:hypothetical protein KC332_g11637 [Hortaea werneckii]|uniref:Uncharacterized protein n=2 Tax=Hortaea werneckii TaxID=91943 RepID=A0A3M7IFE6_HORWE|nr:hypothetical protein KC358_g6897 [Hortaea werneckii]OTA22282.1 hypothetical protein BTJ68_14223 [Hortaea werneckii EXF-2000]KAI6835759.1 hypothetical protein KC350_g6441 [Hortaea werneckii]KAI6931187.1 hypothetical protein KC348_g7352 [Hortaea werneckii]KAI6935718.1 hypothetical protein KC341_g6717 [Hortaea werneckii]
MFSQAQSAWTAALLVQSSVASQLFVSHFSGSIYSLTYEPSNNGNGSLSIDYSTTGCGNMPTWLDSESDVLYCFDESYGAGVVSSFDIRNSSLEARGQADTQGNDVHGCLYGGPNGSSFMATAQYSSSSITTYKLPLTSNTEALQQLSFTMTRKGNDPSRQDAPHPHSTFTDPTGKYMIVPDLGADLVRIFAIDSSTGNLKACTPGKAGAGDGPRHGAWWSPNANSTEGLMLYTVNELSNSVSAWSVSYPASGEGCLSLEKAQTVPTVGSSSSSSSSLAVKAAEVHIRDNFLYAANRNDQTFGLHEDSLVTYNISSNGILDFVEATNAHAWYPRTFSISETGDLVAIGGQTSSNVAIIERNNTTGRLGGLLASIDIATPGQAGQEDGLSAVVWRR